MVFGKSKQQKEIEKRMLIKRTVGEMEKQIQKLERQKEAYIDAGKQAKQRGLTAQYQLALSGLRMTIMQQRRVYEMKLNFEITSQMKDMAKMTADFLDGMSTLSKDMLRLTKQADFAKVQEQFSEAMMGVEVQAEQMEAFMDETQSSFAAGSMTSEENNREMEALIDGEASMGDSTDDQIEKELAALKKKMAE